MSQSPPSDKRIDPDGFSNIVAASYNEGLVESLLEKVKAGIARMVDLANCSLREFRGLMKFCPSILCSMPDLFPV